MKNVPNVGNLWVNLGFMLGYIAIEKIVDYVLSEIKESKLI